MDAIDIRRIFEDSKDHLREFRKDIIRNGQYVRGVQYTAEDRKFLTDLERYPVVYNIIFGKLQAFIGTEKANRIAARVEARESKDLYIANILNQILEHDNEATDFDMQISLAARFAAIYRYAPIMCSWEHTPDYPDGKYVLRALDPLDVFFDYAPHEIDFDESNYIIFSRWFTADHIIQRYANGKPDLEARLEEAATRLEGVTSRNKRKRTYIERYKVGSSYDYSVGDKDETLTQTDFTYKRYDEYSRAAEGLYRVIELHQRTQERFRHINDYKRGIKQQLPRDMSNSDISQLLLAAGLTSEAITEELTDYFKVSVAVPGLTEELVADEPYSVQGAGFAIKILPCYNITPNRLELMSVVDTLIDMQDVVNRDLSSRAFFMSKILNPDWLIAMRAVDAETQLSQFEEKKPGKTIVVNDPNGIREIFPPFGAFNIFSDSVLMAMRQGEEVQGINKNIQGGRQSSDESGRLFQGRVAQAENMLSSIYENISRTIVQIEKFHLGIVQTHMIVPRMVRIIGPGGQKEAEILINEYDPTMNLIKNDVTVGRYDIRIDKGKYTDSEKQFRRDQLTQLMQMSPPEFNILILPLYYKLLDIPESEEILENVRVELEKHTMRSELEKKSMFLQALQTELETRNLLAQLNGGSGEQKLLGEGAQEVPLEEVPQQPTE